MAHSNNTCTGTVPRSSFRVALLLGAGLVFVKQAMEVLSFGSNAGRV